MLGGIHGGNLGGVVFILIKMRTRQEIFNKVMNHQFCVLVRLGCRMEE